MSTEAFSETLQFITNVKLTELEKRRQKFADHATKVLTDSRAHGTADPIKRLNVLVEGMASWPGLWTRDVHLDDIRRWLEQARRDPGFPHPVLEEWIRKCEVLIEHECKRFDFAALFGNLLTDWLKGTSRGVAQTAGEEGVIGMDLDDVGQDGFEKISRKETLEQKEKLESLIFEPKPIDVPALEAYLNDLFSSRVAKEALETLRKRIKKFVEEMRKRPITPEELQQVIKSVLTTDVLSDEKQATLREFARNPTVVKELVGVLEMQRASLSAWTWPSTGVTLEPRRQLNGKTRFFLDAEILTCLLLHYLGARWSTEFRQALEVLRASGAWMQSPGGLTRVDHKRRDAFLGDIEHGQMSVEGLRRKYQQEHFFMCQLPASLDSVDVYADKDDGDAPTVTRRRNRRNKHLTSSLPLGTLGPRFDTPVNLKQSLLHILSADVLLTRALCGQCTVLRTDLEWFGPSLPFQTITTILKFFGLPEPELKFMEAYLACPIVFKDDPSGQVRIRARGVPISYALSTLCGELSLFVMDYAVNRRADGLFLYRIHDDFWFRDAKPERCAAAWKEMNRFASLAGLTFNAEKTGTVTVTSESATAVAEHPDLPRGEIRWGFLIMDATGKFVIDDALIDAHATELRRQLDATTSIFGWTQAYNTYMAFVVRNCGAPARVYGAEHIDGVVGALVRIQRALFSGGSFVDTLTRMIDERVGSASGVRAAAIPRGWYHWPNAAGGLEVRDPLVDLLVLRGKVREGWMEPPSKVLEKAFAEDERVYAQEKAKWESGDPVEPISPAFVSSTYASTYTLVPAHRRLNDVVSAGEPFFSFEEFVRGREERAPWWGRAYEELLTRPKPFSITCTPQLAAALEVLGRGIEAFGVTLGPNDTDGDWASLSPYWQWVIGMHHDEMMKTFGGLAVVEPTSVPVGMVSVFKGSRMRWEQ